MMVMLLSHEDPDDVALGDGGAILDALMMLVDDAALGDGGALVEMPC